MPTRSQSMGTVELANKLLQQNLSRICSSSAVAKAFAASDFAHKFVLSLQIQTQSSSVSFLSFISCPGLLQVENPIQFQKDTFKSLNNHRINNLLNKRRPTSKFPFVVGQYCTLQDEVPVENESKKLRVPVSREIWKVLDILKKGFLIKILNIRTLAIKSVIHSRLENLSLEDIQQVQLNIPDLYDQLVKVQRDHRNTYRPAKRVPSGCFQIPYAGEHDEEVDLSKDEASDDQPDVGYTDVFEHDNDIHRDFEHNFQEFSNAYIGRNNAYQTEFLS